jgi:hypothetical protein
MPELSELLTSLEEWEDMPAEVIKVISSDPSGSAQIADQ